MSQFATSFRTHNCGELRASDAPQPVPRESAPPPSDDIDIIVPRAVARPPAVSLAGHVEQLIGPGAVMLRDRYGKTLVEMDPAALPYVAERFGKLNLQDVIQVRGEAALRQKPDPALPTGEVYVKVSKIELLSKSEPLPAGVLDANEVPIKDRLLHRQLYLRRADVKARLELRNTIANETREWLVAQRFLELETPQLFWYDQVATNPEVVPVPGGKAFSLPNGPVVLDQYIKAGGFDRFFQHVRITRRERKPTGMHAQEHSAFDINMAYVDVEDFLRAIDGLLAHLWKRVLGVELEPVLRLSFADALLRYGTDRVDARFALELVDLPMLASGGVARGLRVPRASATAEDAALEKLLAPIAAGGATLRWARMGPAAPKAATDAKGSAADLFKSQPAALKALGAEPGDFLVVGTGSSDAVGTALGKARLALAQHLKLIDPKRHVPVWVHSYPFLEMDNGNLVPRVVVFARPLNEDMMLMLRENRRAQVRSRTFDLMIDGMEVASGFIGNHNLADQRASFEHLLRMATNELVRVRAPIEAHRFGVPPYGSLNIGFERLVALLTGTTSIDEVMTFPKTAECRDLLMDAPGPVPRKAVSELLQPGPKQTFFEKDLAQEVLKA